MSLIYKLREIKFIFRNWKSKLINGFFLTDIWNLDATIIRFVLPRLKYHRKHCCAWPPQLETHEEWDQIQDKIIKGFELYLCDDFPSDRDQFNLEQEQIKEAFYLFGKYLKYYGW